MGMSRHIRTTVRLEASLLDQARLIVRDKGTTLTALIQQGLQMALQQTAAPVSRKRVVLPVSRERGGTLPGVDLNNSAALLDLMEGRG